MLEILDLAFTAAGALAATAGAQIAALAGIDPIFMRAELADSHGELLFLVSRIIRDDFKYHFAVLFSTALSNSNFNTAII
jgi:hypothetical protein